MPDLALGTALPDPSVIVGLSTELRLTESNHRIANSLALVGGLLRLQAIEIAAGRRSMPAASVAERLAEAATRLEIVGRLHQRLAANGLDRPLDLSGLLQEIAEDTLAALAERKLARLQLELAEACLAPSRLALPFALIAAELITNALRHAHPAGAPGKIRLSLRSFAEDLELEVADDGVGLPEGFDPMAAETLGLRMVRSFARQLNGSLDFVDSPLGLTVTLRTPV